MLTSQLSAPIPAEVVYRGWSHGQLPLPAAGEWESFAAFWDDLPPDAYVKPGHGAVRYRRIGRLFVPGGPDGARAEILPPDHFVQSTSVNAVYGGQARVFAPIGPQTYEHGYFRAVLGRDLEMIREIAAGESGWLITVHLIRIEAAGGRSSAPAPEGRHSDGHDFIVMHLVGRRYCAGGDSTLYRAGDQLPVLARTLTHAMETIAIDDQAMEHAVSPITADENPVATRDMMIVDFERANAATGAGQGSIELDY
jgi:hypothetical protein